MINWEKLFDQPVKNIKVTYENIRRIATGQGDDYTTGYLLDYPHFKDSYKMIVADLSKQQALDADPRANQQINFTANFDRAVKKRMYLIFEDAKETKLDFSQGTVIPHKLLLTNRQVADLCRAFTNRKSTDIKLSKTQLYKKIKSEGFLGRLLDPVIRAGLPLMKSVNQPLDNDF